jgi:ATP-binding cassette subfamily B protein
LLKENEPYRKILIIKQRLKLPLNPIPIAEAEIYSKFDEIAKDQTAIYISHRMSSCCFCDRIAVFDNGRIVQQGLHKELLTDIDGEYRKLWNAQARYYKE